MSEDLHLALAAANEKITLMTKWLEDREKALESMRTELASKTATIEAMQDGGAVTPAAEPEPQPEPQVDSLGTWIDTQLLPLIEINIGTAHRWCSQWHEHPEATARLSVLHQDFLRALATPDIGLGGWFRNSLDHHLPMLTRPDGPFSGCNPNEHEEPHTLQQQVQLHRQRIPSQVF